MTPEQKKHKKKLKRAKKLKKRKDATGSAMLKVTPKKYKTQKAKELDSHKITNEQVIEQAKKMSANSIPMSDFMIKNVEGEERVNPIVKIFRKIKKFFV